VDHDCVERYEWFFPVVSYSTVRMLTFIREKKKHRDLQNCRDENEYVKKNKINIFMLLLERKRKRFKKFSQLNKKFVFFLFRYCIVYIHHHPHHPSFVIFFYF
jgi:hypothetical protein